MDFLLRNASVVNEGRQYVANIHISDGIITGIDDTLSLSGKPGATEIDLTGLYLLPGVIDEHVHFRDPGFTYKADMESESRAAVAGGVTSFMDMPNTNPQTTTNQLVEEKYRYAEGRCYANYGFYLGATNDNVVEIKSVNPHLVPGIKVFVGSSTGNMLTDDEAVLDRIFAESPILIAVHSEDEGLIRQNLQIARNLYGGDPDASVHPFIRNSEVCFNASKRIVELAKMHNSRLHVLHVTTEKELSLFSPELIQDKRITAEVTVNHLWYDERDYATKSNLIKCNPAIKGESDKLALRQALAEGLIDTIGTDHAPHTLDEKMRPYYQAPSGMPSIQHSLLAMLEMSKRGIFKLEMIPVWMSHNPAICYKIHNRGFVREGYAADLTVVDLHSETQVTRGNYYYKCGWSPYDGTDFTSKIRYTFVNGCMAYDGKSIVGTPNGKGLIFNWN